MRVRCAQRFGWLARVSPMSDCCQHPVERHAYNGCAECGCGVPWTKHPERDYDTSEGGLEANKAYRESLEKRIDELIKMTCKVSLLSSRVCDLGTKSCVLKHKHWQDCIVNHGGAECDMGPECGDE